MIAGALSAGAVELNLTSLLRLLILWLLVDPVLGMLWELSTQQGLWRRLVPAHLPPPSRQGFYLPYAQPGSMAGRIVLDVRCYQQWWREHFWPEQGSQLITFGLGVGLALLISLAFNPTLFWLTLLAIGLIILAGTVQADLSAADGGRLQSIVQLLLPWVMGTLLWLTLTPVSLILAICYWVTYLGGLRMLGAHRRAEILFFAGQIAAIVLLLALRFLPGAAILAILFITQWVIKTKFHQPGDFLPRVQPYLVFSLLVAGWSLGQVAG
jgi:hypothetical protein